jgi:formamidopyrimidine-DNA glycosylase
MPELPEVEVTRRRIAPLLLGRRISAVETTARSYVFITPPGRLRTALPGLTPTALDRLGKYLLARFDDESTLVVHLGMTGQLFSSRATSPRLLSATARASLSPDAQRDFEPDSHTHLRLRFEDGGPEIYFRDVRKFGKLLLLARGRGHARLERLGPDALDVDGTSLFAATRRRRAPIKALLLDQSVLAGIGNIYADEALSLARVRPGRRASRLTRREAEALAAGIVHVLERSIATGGSSISDYVAPDGRDGRYQDERRVYGREGEPCHACGSPIRRRMVAQRSAHYCPNCQK